MEYVFVVFLYKVYMFVNEEGSIYVFFIWILIFYKNVNVFLDFDFFFLYVERKIYMGFLNFIYWEDIIWNMWNFGFWVYKYVFLFLVICNYVLDWSFCVNFVCLFIGLCGGVYYLWM